MTLASALRALRQSAGLSCRALAKLADISPAYVSEIELGRSVPTLSVALRLATALNRSLLEVAGLSAVDAARDIARSPLLVAEVVRADYEPAAAAPLDVERLRQGGWNEAMARMRFVFEGDNAATAAIDRLDEYGPCWDLDLASAGSDQSDHQHVRVDMRNRYVESGERCEICNAIRAGSAGSDQPGGAE